MDAKAPHEYRHSLGAEIGSNRLFALVDGLQYKACRNVQMSEQQAFVAHSLLAGTLDAALSDAGPWLVEVTGLETSALQDLQDLERQAPGLMWLSASLEVQALKALLQRLMNAKAPGGQDMLLRLWDPRVLPGLLGVLDSQQRGEFFAGIQQWRLLKDGLRQVLSSGGEGQTSW